MSPACEVVILLYYSRVNAWALVYYVCKRNRVYSVICIFIMPNAKIQSGLAEETYVGFVWNVRFCVADGVSCVVFLLCDNRKLWSFSL